MSTENAIRKRLSEDAVKNAVIAHLNGRWRAVGIKTMSEHGPDIVMRHRRYGRYFWIEAKGDPGKKAVSQKSGREVRIMQSFGQLLIRINPDRGYYYGLAYPASYRKSVLGKIRYPHSFKKLKIHLFFVTDGKHVEHLTWKDLPNLKNK